jgi:hypothetical protein
MRACDEKYICGETRGIESFETYGQTSAKQKSKLVSTAIFWRFLVVEGGGFDVLF